MCLLIYIYLKDRLTVKYSILGFLPKMPALVGLKQVPEPPCGSLTWLEKPKYLSH